MASDSTTQARWPLLDERAPFAAASSGPRRRRIGRSTWLLTGLAFLCGGLVSAAAFSIGWRHQAQRDTSARAALATATARVTHLSTSLAAARATIAQDKQAAAQAAAAAQATSRAATSLASKANAAGGSADTVSAEAGVVGASATRVSRELQTLLTYLTTTPSSQIDSGYIASQAAYLTRQLSTLQDGGAAVDRAVTSFKADLQKLARDARALASH